MYYLEIWKKFQIAESVEHLLIGFCLFKHLINKTTMLNRVWFYNLEVYSKWFIDISLRTLNITDRRQTFWTFSLCKNIFLSSFTHVSSIIRKMRIWNIYSFFGVLFVLSYLATLIKVANGGLYFFFAVSASFITCMNYHRKHIV